MRCQRCEKPATFHITELQDGQVEEVHLCEEHARQYLAHTETETPAGSSTMAGAIVQHFQLAQTAEDLAELDQRSCPVCGITFYEFRNQGRLGCPHDYTAFQQELEPLIVNIHGAMEHTGKQPQRTGSEESETMLPTDLIRLRREMKEAVEREDYERASELRDEIRRFEQE